jgi:hypothetical protein
MNDMSFASTKRPVFLIIPIIAKTGFPDRVRKTEGRYKAKTLPAT